MNTLTLNQAAALPHLLTWNVALPNGAEFVFRPITVADEAGLREFLVQLSVRTRRFYLEQSPAATAADWCRSIARYDKLRLLVADAVRVVGIVEFSLDLPPGDLERYRSYGCELQAATDCRFGLCLADELHGHGLATALLAPVREIARRFGRTRIILWGGVMADNNRARAYYRRSGFQTVGEFVKVDGTPSIDMILQF